MTTPLPIPRWQAKQEIHSKTAYEHREQTGTNDRREALVLQALSDLLFEGDAMRDKVLQMYLNECWHGKNEAWYETTQKAFMANHPEWVEGFAEVFSDRRKHGSNNQKANIMGDWLALSQLSGTPLPWDILFFNKPQHPRDTRAPVTVHVPPPKKGAYKSAFSLLYAIHHGEDPRWDSMLRRMNIESLTPGLWDAYVERWPDETMKPLDGVACENYEWIGILDRLLEAKHADELAQLLVERMVNGEENNVLYTLTHNELVYTQQSLHGEHLSRALYDALDKKPDLRNLLSTQHLVHAINAQPRRMKQELDYAAGTTVLGMAAKKLVAPPYVGQLSIEARQQMLALFKKKPHAYSELIALQFCNISSCDWSFDELKSLLATNHAKARLVATVIDGKADTFLRYCASVVPGMVQELEAADFEIPHMFETIAMPYLTPTFDYAHALQVKAISESLGQTTDNAWAIYQAAMDGSRETSFPISGLLDDAFEPGR